MAPTFQLQLREHWRDLRRGRPGRRFVARYERARSVEKRCGTGERVLLMVAAALAFVIGLFLVVFPGPAFPFFIVAGGLLATESRTIARFMDWSEVRVRKIVAWAKRRWRHLPRAGRAVLLVIGACCSVGPAYLSYRLLRG